MDVPRKRRSKTGCLTCRKRKIKCDETRPKCKGCTHHRFACNWPRPTEARRVSSSHETRHLRHGHSNNHLRPSLTERHLECANSLTLTSQDRLFLEHFSSSNVYCTYNFSQWGTLQYVLTELAPSSKLVTRMLLALSASEMYKRGLCGNAQDFDPGLSHYTQGIVELRYYLHRELTLTGEDDVETAIVALFFMVHYELQFTGSKERVKIHIRGLWAIIRSHPLFKQQDMGSSGKTSHGLGGIEPRLTLSCQMIFWVLYLDIAGTVSGGCCSLLKLLTRSGNPTLNPSRLNEISRLGSHTMWRREIPASFQLEQVELYRPVEFGTQVFSTRFNIWDLNERGGQTYDENITVSSLWDYLIKLRKKYCDILLLAHESPNFPWTQNMETITRITTFYWACVLYHHHTFSSAEPHNELHGEAVSNITKLLFYRYQQDSDIRRQSRIVWPTLIAAIQTHDPIHRCWLMDRLGEARHLTAECEHTWSIAQGLLTTKHMLLSSQPIG